MKVIIELEPERTTKIIFVEMNQSEALRTIESLLHQINNSFPNSGRLESRTENGDYFSIAIVE